MELASAPHLERWQVVQARDALALCYEKVLGRELEDIAVPEMAGAETGENDNMSEEEAIQFYVGGRRQRFFECRMGGSRGEAAQGVAAALPSKDGQSA